MKNKIIAAIIVAVFLAALVPMNTISATPPTSNPIIGLSHPKLEAGLKSTDPDELPGLDGSAFLENAYVEGLVPMLTPESPWTVYVSDDYYGGVYEQDFTNVLNGTHCNIWVGLNYTDWSGYTDEWQVNGPGFADDMFFFAYPWSSTGRGTRMLPGYRDYIYGSQLIELMNEFDTNIWQTCKDFFGDYADRPGPFNDYKIQILIFNIREDFFYLLSATSFIEGYFWSYISNLYSANIMHIDTYQWWRRQGPTPDGGNPTYFVDTYPASSRMPYEYEGTFAHEYQHLIHRDVDADEYSWVNEGCSGLAQVVCGYGFPAGHILEYIYYWWQTSLVIWEGQLANYGATFLFAYYMYEHYGGQPFIYALVHEQANGIQGYNNVLEAFHIRKDFDQIFEDWAIANYLDDTSIYNGIYGYYGLDIPSADTYWDSIQAEMEWWQANYGTSWFEWIVNSYPNYGYNYPYYAQLPYTVNYVLLGDGSPVLQVDFDGADYSGIPAYSPTHEWWSDGTGNSWFRLGQTFSVPVGGATLDFWTYYDIEEDYDYGYVEVHDLDTGEWYTLAGGSTQTGTNVDGYDNPNCPTEFEPETYATAGRWYAFTGYSYGWYQESMDLTPFAGHDIDLYFTYWTDPYTLGSGWYVDDIEIPELGFFDDVEGGANGWTVNAGWEITTGVVPNNFEVNFIRTINIAVGSSTTAYSIVPMKLNSTTQEGSILLPCMDNCPVLTFGPHVMVAANQPGFEHTFYTYYDFYADTIGFPPHPP